jgi:hypothetical protein
MLLGNQQENSAARIRTEVPNKKFTAAIWLCYNTQNFSLVFIETTDGPKERHVDRHKIPAQIMVLQKRQRINNFVTLYVVNNQQSTNK